VANLFCLLEQSTKQNSSLIGDKMDETELKPLDADGRGYTEVFECQNCKALIWAHILTKDIDYNFCPYCGMKVKD